MVSVKRTAQQMIVDVLQSTTLEVVIF
jgi:hypothetical protein